MTTTRRHAIAILNRMGEPYGHDDVAEVMSGDAWYPASDIEWQHYEGRAHDRSSCPSCLDVITR